MSSSHQRPRVRERTAKLFMNGGSQAVRLPREFRFPGTEVRVRREGRGVLLEPAGTAGWPRGYWRTLERLRQGLDLHRLRRPPDAPPRPLAFELEE